MNARILAGTILLLSATAAAAQPYADGPLALPGADPEGVPGTPAAVRPGGSGPEAGSDIESGARAAVLLRAPASVLLRAPEALFPLAEVEAGPGREGHRAEAVLAGALEDAASGNLLAAVLGPLFPGRTDWSTPLPRDLPVTPFVTSAPGWPGAWSVGVKLPRGP